MKWIVTIVFLLTGSFCLSSQSNNSFRILAETSAPQVGVPFQVTVQIDNFQIEKYTNPIFKGCRVLGSPSSGQNFSYINGKVSRSQTFTYQVVAEVQGEITIGPAQASNNGKSMQSNTLKMMVSSVPKLSKRQTQGDKNRQSDIFVRASLSKDKGKLGEQIILSYQIYSRINVDNIVPLQQMSIEGAYVKAHTILPQNTEQLTINGQVYTTKVLQKFSIYPQSTGVITIPAQRFEAMVSTSDDSFFGLIVPDFKQIILGEQSLNIEIEDLSQISSGALPVGQGEVKWLLNQNIVELGKPINLRLSIALDADQKRIIPPQLFVNDSIWRIFSPKVIRDEISEGESGFISQKLFEYSLVPRKKGKHVLNPEFTYFDNQLKQIVKVNQQFEVEVIDRKNAPYLSEDQDPPRFWDNLKKQSPYIYGSLAAALIFLFWFIWKKQKPQETQQTIAKKERARVNTSDEVKSPPLVSEKIKVDTSRDDLTKFLKILQAQKDASIETDLGNITAAVDGLISSKYKMNVRNWLLSPPEAVPSKVVSAVKDLFKMHEMSKYGGKPIDQNELEDLRLVIIDYFDS